MARSSAARRSAPLVVVLLIAALVSWMVYIRKETGELTMWPAAAPERIHVFGRTYLRGAPSPAPDPAAVPVGETLGRGTVLATPPHPYVPTGVWVQDGDAFVAYGLSGGP